jgi:cysteine sulfinate desulfinase/cysteine desulfurase-like protein
MAMDIPESFAKGTLRLTCGPKITPDEIDKAAMTIADIVEKLYAESNASES